MTDSTSDSARPPAQTRWGDLARRWLTDADRRARRSAIDARAARRARCRPNPYTRYPIPPISARPSTALQANRAPGPRFRLPAVVARSALSARASDRRKRRERRRARGRVRGRQALPAACERQLCRDVAHRIRVRELGGGVLRRERRRIARSLRRERRLSGLADLGAVTGSALHQSRRRTLRAGHYGAASHADEHRRRGGWRFQRRRETRSLCRRPARAAQLSFSRTELSAAERRRAL